jgi:cytosine/adenosine deaminase-related metal-dependent hydrolase
MSEGELIIKGGVVLQGPPLEQNFNRSDIRVRDGVVVEIGPDLEPSTPGTEVLDAHDAYVLPGFVDAHQHLWESTLRGVTAGGGFADFFFRIRIMHGAVHTADDVYAGVYAGALTSLDAGTTTVVDHMHVVNSPDHAMAGLEALRRSGLRARWSLGTSGGPVAEPVFADQSARWDHARSVRSREFASQSSADRVSMGLAIADLGSYDWDTTRREYDLVRELDVHLTAHGNCFWGPRHPGEIEGLHRHGLLGERQLYSHCNSSSDHELALLAETGASMVSTPETELQLGLGLPVFARAAAAGARAGLGSDIQANNSPDMFTQMRLAMHTVSASVHQRQLDAGGTGTLQRPALDPATVYHHATLGSAEAIGLGDQVGSLEVGKAADVVLLRLSSLWHLPVIDPMATIVQHASVRDVETVVVGGDVVKRNGTLPAAQAREAAQLMAAAWERLEAQVAARGGVRPELPDGLWDQVVDAVNTNMT